MVINRLSLLLYFSILISSLCNSKNIYFDRNNNFGVIEDSIFFLDSDYNIIQNNVLIDENITSRNRFNIQKFDLDNSNYSFRMRLANLNNKENKKYIYYDANGDRHIVRSTQWGIIWNYVDDENYYRAEIRCINTDLHSIDDRRIMKFSLIRCINNKDEILFEKEIVKDVNLYTGYNTIDIRLQDSCWNVLMGNEKLHEIISVPLNIHDIVNGTLGYFVGPGAKLAIEKIELDYKIIKNKELTTNWTKSALEEYFKTSQDVIEGYWTYLDYSFDGEKLGIGGEYKLAIIKEDNKYKMLYINGAKINKSQWLEGMVKGELAETKFINHYDLIWYDAMMDPFEKNVFAKIDENMILELNFPVQKSKLRFFKE